MKVFLLFAGILTITITSHAQNLSLDQVIALRSKDLAAVEEFLTSKNWELNKASGPDEKTMGSASFAYQKSDYNDKASSFINYYYNESFSNNRISIQVNTLSIYNSFIARLKALNYQLASSKVVNSDIVKVYKGHALTIQIRSSIQKTDFTTKAIYQFFICSSLDYAQLFEE